MSTEIGNARTSWDLGSNAGKFDVLLRLRVPEQTIRVVPALMTVIKFAWIQFFVIYVVLFIFSRVFHTFLVKSRSLTTKVTWPSLKPKDQ